MYIKKNRARYVTAAAAVTTSVAVAVAAAGVARADTGVTPDPGSIEVPTGLTAAHSPPGAVAGLFARIWPSGPHATVVSSYEVADGDSFWAIAEQQLPDGATKRDILTLTGALMAYNAPRLGYDVSAMLRPGDVVGIVAAPASPSSAASAPAARDEGREAPASHDVVAGDSYWAIAEATLGDSATPADVLAKSEELIELNSPRLGYDDPQMLHAGDVVYLEDGC